MDDLNEGFELAKRWGRGEFNLPEEAGTLLESFSTLAEEAFKPEAADKWQMSDDDCVSPEFEREIEERKRSGIPAIESMEELYRHYNPKLAAVDDERDAFENMLDRIELLASENGIDDRPLLWFRRYLFRGPKLTDSELRAFWECVDSLRQKTHYGRTSRAEEMKRKGAAAVPTRAATELLNAEIHARLSLLKIHALCSASRSMIPLPKNFATSNQTYFERFVDKTEEHSVELDPALEESLASRSRAHLSAAFLHRVSTASCRELDRIDFSDTAGFDTAFQAAAELPAIVFREYPYEQIAGWIDGSEEGRIEACHRFEKWVNEWLPPTRLAELYARLQGERDLYVRMLSENGEAIDYSPPVPSPSSKQTIDLWMGERDLNRDIENWDQRLRRSPDSEIWPEPSKEVTSEVINNVHVCILQLYLTAEAFCEDLSKEIDTLDDFENEFQVGHLKKDYEWCHAGANWDSLRFFQQAYCRLWPNAGLINEEFSSHHDHALAVAARFVLGLQTKPEGELQAFVQKYAIQFANLPTLDQLLKHEAARAQLEFAGVTFGSPPLPPDQVATAMDATIPFVGHSVSGDGIPANDDAASVLERAGMAMGETGMAVFHIANSTKSSDTKMREICDLDAGAVTWNSPRWAKLLGVTASAIRRTNFWRFERPKRFEDARSEWTRIHPDDELPEELRSLGD